MSVVKSGSDVVVHDEQVKRSNEKLEKHKGKKIKSLNQAELAELVEAMAERLGLLNEKGELR